MFNEEVENIAREILEKHGYNMEKIIGSGAFASCFLVKRKKSNYFFASKIIYANCAILGDKCHVVEDTYTDEMTILKQLSHPNIIPIYDHFIVGPFRIIILEYCPNGDLNGLFKDNKGLPTCELIKYSQQLAEALRYLHEHNVSHHDIKPSNCLIDANGRLRLSDFGLAKKNDTLDSDLRKGTMAFIAPEVITKGSYDPFKADVWSFGVTLYKMLSGKIPLQRAKTISDLKREQPLWAQSALEINGPSWIVRIICRCLSYQPSKRPTMQEITDIFAKEVSRISNKKILGRTSPFCTLKKKKSLGKAKRYVGGRFSYSKINQGIKPIMRPSKSHFHAVITTMKPTFGV